MFCCFVCSPYRRISKCAFEIINQTNWGLGFRNGRLHWCPECNTYWEVYKNEVINLSVTEAHIYYEVPIPLTCEHLTTLLKFIAAPDNFRWLDIDWKYRSNMVLVQGPSVEDLSKQFSMPKFVMVENCAIIDIYNRYEANTTVYCKECNYALSWQSPLIKTVANKVFN